MNSETQSIRNEMMSSEQLGLELPDLLEKAIKDHAWIYPLDDCILVAQADFKLAEFNRIPRWNLDPRKVAAHYEGLDVSDQEHSDAKVYWAYCRSKTIAELKLRHYQQNPDEYYAEIIGGEQGWRKHWQDLGMKLPSDIAEGPTLSELMFGLKEIKHTMN